jgi:hypothetical protein
MAELFIFLIFVAAFSVFFAFGGLIVDAFLRDE